MYGKIFASTFTGSMFGAGPDVFAVWAYVIAHVVDSTVELNPVFLSGMLGMSSERVETAIRTLESADPRSRNPKQDGRRIVHESGFQYHVTSHEIYRNMKDEGARREYQRDWIRNKRAVSKPVDTRRQMSTHTEAEAEAETGERIPPGDPATLRSGPLTGHGLKRMFSAIREREIPGTLSWQTPATKEGKDSTMADTINADPTARGDVDPTMLLFFQKAKGGKFGKDSKKMVEDPTFGFGCWMSKWTLLREELRGKNGTDEADHDPGIDAIVKAMNGRPQVR